MLSSLWNALWGTNTSIQETRREIEQSAQQLSQYPWVPENHTAPTPSQHNVAATYGSSPSHGSQDNSLGDNDLGTQGMNDNPLPTPQLYANEERRARRLERRAERRRRRHAYTIPPASSSTPTFPMTMDPFAIDTTNDASGSSSSSSSHPQPSSTDTISRPPVVYPQYDPYNLHPKNGFKVDKIIQHAVLYDMLDPDMWNTLSGENVQQWIEVPYLVPDIESYFGEQGRLTNAIREKTTGVEVKVEFPRMILCGPQMKVNRVADTVFCMITKLGKVKLGSINLVCKGPDLAIKVAQLKESVGDVMNVSVKEDRVRISFASFGVKKEARMAICNIRDELLHILGSITPEHQPEPFICNFYQFLGKHPKKTLFVLPPQSENEKLDALMAHLSTSLASNSLISATRFPKTIVLETKSMQIPKMTTRKGKVMKMRVQRIPPPNQTIERIPEELLSDFFGSLQVKGVDITYVFRPRTVEIVEIPVTFQSFDLF
ncbi:hypothetical protein K492DRAFT_204579 [Lichtheimia hyalospora FSU 10163]|nr:hypothetical protein K492DRAFT_204579 [Lichtheimia hyalospora FSU 10163]